MTKTKTCAIGIDLGTSYSCVGIWEKNHVEILENNLGNRKTPSYIAFNNNEWIVGETALNKIGMNPKYTIFGIKRLMGLTIDDYFNKKYYYPFEIKYQKNHKKPLIPVKVKEKYIYFTPEEFSSMILSKMKETAENYLGQPITDVVITVPAYFKDSQRQATIDAGKIAGLNVLQIINEPTAAAITYCFNKKVQNEENIIIADFGGGTYDVSLININNGSITVKATAGDSHFGGEDFNNRLICYFIEEFRKKYKKDISNNPKSLVRLRKECEKAKCILSSLDEATIEIDCLYEDIDFYSKITRSCFEKICSDLFKKVDKPIEIVLKEAKLNKKKINEIILIGGSTRIPKVREIVSSFFNGKRINKTLNVDEAVAYGAAIQAFILSGEGSMQSINIKLKDIIPYSLRIPSFYNNNLDILVKRNSPFPTIVGNYDITNYYNYFKSFRVYEVNHLLKNNIKLLDQYILNMNSINYKKINAILEIDKNGILKVSFRYDNKKEKSIQYFDSYFNTGRLTTKIINDMKNRIEKLRDDNDREKERFEIMNDLEKYCYELRKYLNGKKYMKKINDFENNLNNNDDISIIELFKNDQNGNKNIIMIINDFLNDKNNLEKEIDSTIEW
eukprot:jgi/Orpsp1_1/1187932/evm.model.d7180000061247.1